MSETTETKEAAEVGGSRLEQLVGRLREEALNHQTVYEEDRRRKLLFAEAATEIERLRGVIAEAADCVQGWGAYASDYFQQKHDLNGTVRRLRDEAYL